MENSKNLKIEYALTTPEETKQLQDAIYLLISNFSIEGTGTLVFSTSFPPDNVKTSIDSIINIAPKQDLHSVISKVYSNTQGIGNLSASENSISFNIEKYKFSIEYKQPLIDNGKSTK